MESTKKLTRDEKKVLRLAVTKDWYADGSYNFYAMGKDGKVTDRQYRMRTVALDFLAAGFSPEEIKRANRIARAKGCCYATDIVRSDADKVVKMIASGYRKYTTREYVSAAYRNNFGWKNTFYQNLICVVGIAA